MAFRDDNTTIVRMKRDFDSFIQDHNESRGVSAFRLDDSGSNGLAGAVRDTEVIQVQALLGMYTYITGYFVG